MAHLKRPYRRAYLQRVKGTCKGIEAPGAGDRGQLLPEVPGEEIVLLQPSGRWMGLQWGNHELETGHARIWPLPGSWHHLRGHGKKTPFLVFLSVCQCPVGASHWPNQTEAREQESLGDTVQDITFQDTEQRWGG